MKYNEICNVPSTLTDVPFDKVEEDVIVLVLPEGDKSFCFTRSEIEVIRGESEVMLWVRDENGLRPRKDHPIFMIPYVNVWVDDSLYTLMQGIHRIFYLYPAYVSTIGSRPGVGRHVGTEHITIYSAIPISQNLFEMNSLRQIRRIINIQVPEMLSFERINEIVDRPITQSRNRIPRALTFSRRLGEQEEKSEGGESPGEEDDGFESEEDEIFQPDNAGQENEWRRWAMHNAEEGANLLEVGEDDFEPEDNENFFDQEREIPPLVNACSEGDLRLVNQLIEEGVDPSMENNRCIILAAKHGHLDVIERLVEDERVDPFDQANYAFIEACFEDHLIVVEYLLSIGADPSAQENIGFIEACSRGHTEIVLFLLDIYNRNPNKLDPFDQENLAFIEATARGHIDIMKILLEYADLIPLDQNSEAVVLALRYGQIDALKLLIEHFKENEEEKINLSIRENEGLLGACREDKPESVLFLIEHKVDITYPNNEALMIASERGYLEIATLLLNNGADSNAQDNKAIIIASEQGYIDIVNLLLEKGADPSAQNNLALRNAYAQGHRDVIDRLVQDPRVNDDVEEEEDQEEENIEEDEQENV